MKRLALAFLLILFISFNTQHVFAQTTASGSAQKKVDYTLPYPGILPDNPLYYLKAIRDNIFKFLISDPLKKTQFDLLQADKRLGASRQLLQKGKNDLAVTTLSKSGNYFDDAIANIQKAKKQGDDVSSTLSNLYTASLKHQEVIREMEKGKSGDLLLNLKFLEERARDFGQRVEIIQSL